MKCECKKILWIKIECKSCKKSRIKKNQKWEKDHTFVYGEQVFVNNDFMGRKAKGTIVDKEKNLS